MILAFLVVLAEKKTHLVFFEKLAALSLNLDSLRPV